MMIHIYFEFLFPSFTYEDMKGYRSKCSSADADKIKENGKALKLIWEDKGAPILYGVTHIADGSKE